MYRQNHPRINGFPTSDTFFTATQKSTSLTLEHILKDFSSSENYKTLPM
jgi:hypothetical protein